MHSTKIRRIQPPATAALLPPPNNQRPLLLRRKARTLKPCQHTTAQTIHKPDITRHSPVALPPPIVSGVDFVVAGQLGRLAHFELRDWCGDFEVDDGGEVVEGDLGDYEASASAVRDGAAEDC